MLALRIAAGLTLAYVALVGLAWLVQERLAFPAPHGAAPDPKRVGVAHGEESELFLADRTKLAGWYLKAVEGGEERARAVTGDETYTATHRPPSPSPALLWFYGNGENVATIWPIVRDFQPPGTALLVVDYPGYGGSGGRATEAGLYAAADAAYAELARRPEVDASRIFVYGRSLGSAVASHVAAGNVVAGLVLESPFTNALDIAREHYALFPRFIVRLRLDNLANLRLVRCPVLVFHGTADRLAPLAMGRRVAAAAAGGPAELVLIQGAGHTDTYDLGGEAYRRKLWQFVLGGAPVR